MAYNDVHAGYRGLADIDTIGNCRFSDASISVKQVVDAPDLVTGDWDHDAYNYGKIEVGGTISGPVGEVFLAGAGGGGLWQWAAYRDTTCGILSAHDITLYYYCGGSQANSRKFSSMLVNSLGFSCAAGDVAQFTMDFQGISADPWASATPPNFTTPEKLLTWDKVGVSITPGDSTFIPPANIAYSNFDFNISNNLTPVYSLGQADLFPFDIVPGMRTITGSLSVYDTPESNGVDTWDDYVAAGVSTITFNINTMPISMKVRFARTEPSLSVAPVVSTIAFVGVTAQSWDH